MKNNKILKTIIVLMIIILISVILPIYADENSAELKDFGLMSLAK